MVRISIGNQDQVRIGESYVSCFRNIGARNNPIFCSQIYSSKNVAGIDIPTPKEKSMRSLLAAVVLTLFLVPAAFAGGGNFDEMPQQQMAAQTKIVVVQPRGDNTAAYVAAAAVIVAAGIGYLGVRRNRKG